MTDVHTIENPERQMQRLAERGEFIKAFSNEHAPGEQQDLNSASLAEPGCSGGEGCHAAGGRRMRFIGNDRWCGIETVEVLMGGLLSSNNFACSQPWL